MGLLAIPKERIRLGRLRRQLAREPYPHGFAEAARGYLALGDLEQAREILADGLRLFPEAEELAKARTFLVTRDRQAEFIAAKERLRTDPTLQSYLALADAYEALGKPDQCSQTLREAMEKFPRSSTPSTKLADLRYARFLSGCAAADGQAAEQLYKRACELEPEALKPRFMLAQYYCRIGARSHASDAVRVLLELSPEHERGLQLLALLERKTDATDGLEDVTSLVQAVEEHQRFAIESLPWEERQDPVGRAPISAPAQEVERLGTRFGTARVVVIDGVGKEHFAGAQYNVSLKSAVTDLAPICHRAARGMELGPPQRLEISGADGTLVIEMKRDVAAGIVLEAGADSEVAITAARDALERMVRG